MLLFSANAESWPGYRFPAEITKEHITDGGKETIWIIRIKSDDALKDELNIRFENEKRKVTNVIWMTKGNYPLKTPSFGMYIPPKPTPDSKPIVILNHQKLKEVEYADIALVNFIWEEPKGEPVR